MNALISVSDKTGIVEFARALHALGIRLLSTGGTAQLLAKEGLPVTEVAEVTQFPEMLDGRVKTLHPKVHGGLLARRDVPAHMAALAEHGIDTIDLLVVNLYPFEATVAKAGCTLADAIENIDIGGPAMVRSAAKNWKDVGVITAADQYDAVIAELKAAGKLSNKLRFELSVAAFNRITAWRLKTGSNAEDILKWGVGLQLAANVLMVLLVLSFGLPPMWLLVLAVMLSVGTQGLISANTQACFMAHFRSDGGSANALLMSGSSLIAALMGWLATMLHDGTVNVMAGMMLLSSLLGVSLLWGFSRKELLPKR